VGIVGLVPHHICMMMGVVDTALAEGDAEAVAAALAAGEGATGTTDATAADLDLGRLAADDARRKAAEAHVQRHMDLYYFFAPDSCGRGLATEAGAAVVAAAFAAAPDLHRLVAGTKEGNVGSQRLLRKLGFRDAVPNNSHNSFVLSRAQHLQHQEAAAAKAEASAKAEANAASSEAKTAEAGGAGGAGAGSASDAGAGATGGDGMMCEGGFCVPTGAGAGAAPFSKFGNILAEIDGDK